MLTIESSSRLRSRMSKRNTMHSQGLSKIYLMQQQQQYLLRFHFFFGGSRTPHNRRSSVPEVEPPPIIPPPVLDTPNAPNPPTPAPTPGPLLLLLPHNPANAFSFSRSLIDLLPPAAALAGLTVLDPRDIDHKSSKFALVFPAGVPATWDTFRGGAGAGAGAAGCMDVDRGFREAAPKRLVFCVGAAAGVMPIVPKLLLDPNMAGCGCIVGWVVLVYAGREGVELSMSIRLVGLVV